MPSVPTKKIYDISKEILLACGLPTEDADIVADTIVSAHRKEKHTHGLGRLSIYHRKTSSGLMSPTTTIKKVSDRGVVAVYDAENGFGQVAAYKGMQTCLEKAAALGIGVVAIRNSNSFGTADYFGEMAAKEGMVGIVMGNASPALATPGGNRALVGTNPLCFAFPGTGAHPPIVLDMACSVVARGKIRMALKNGEKIPSSWAVDADGIPTDDPEKALEGMINAIGGYKGFGLALVVDILAGLMSGSAFAGDVKALNAPEGFSRYGHFLAAINTSFFLDDTEYQKRMDYLVDQTKGCGEPGAVLLPGERSFLNSRRNTEDVDLPEKLVDDTNDLASLIGAGVRL
ncbi:MAG: Ldh family oxidoreductase [Coriobacteriia bacterium]|nr:Ldh family oxidoreductase [Coriobacteriia bacterium]